ncbi:MAG: type VI secretion system Vgr family protein [Sphingomonadaceae bacterium]
MSGYGERMLAAALSALGFSAQDQRLLRMDFPLSDGPAGSVMLVNSLRAREEMSRDFRFEVEVLSDDAHIPLKAMMGRMVTISLVRNDGSLRYFNGYVTEFRLLRTDGGFVFYHMLLQPWLALARLRKDSVTFLDCRLQELTETTFAHYREHDWQTRLHDELPPISCANQYNETDYNHLHRRWEAQGLHYWYEHRPDGHTLWLGDDTTLAEDIDAGGDGGIDGAIVFRSQSGSGEGDGIREWQPVRRLGSSAMTVASFDYKNPSPLRSAAVSRRAQGDVASFEHYENTGAYGFKDADDGELLAQRRMDESDQLKLQFEAAGNDRNAQAGRVFRLDGHFSAETQAPSWNDEAKPSIGARRYLILKVEHEANNNYHAGPNAASHYNNSMLCVRQEDRWRPGRYFNSVPATFAGVQTALVVGPEGEEIYTDGLGRIRLQFHWDRLGQYDQASSQWVRVMMPMAGSYFGQGGLPRVGQEVVVQFVEGNLDRPIVIGVAYNQAHLPPWDLPQQQALAGLRSQELGDANRGNHLILDDTRGKIQAQLKSDHQCSQLSLGSIARIDDHTGRKDERGEGWELRTDGHGVMRAGSGMLITTEARSNASAHIKSMDETTQRLQQAGERQDALAKQAFQHGAQESQAQQGSSVAAIQAQNSAVMGANDLTSGFPELSAPHLILSSPAGIETTSAQSTHIASGEHTAISSGRNLSLATGAGLFASIGEAFRLFVHTSGMKLIAASGKVTVAAQTDDLDVVANKVLHLISQGDWVDVRGRKGIRLHGANCMVEISDKVQFFTSSPTLFHGNLETLAPQFSAQPPIDADRRQEIDKLLNEDSWIEFCLTDGDKPLAGQRFLLSDPEGRQHTGSVDSNGVARVSKIKQGKCTVTLPDIGYDTEVQL